MGYLLKDSCYPHVPHIWTTYGIFTLYLQTTSSEVEYLNLHEFTAILWSKWVRITMVLHTCSHVIPIHPITGGKTNSGYLGSPGKEHVSKINCLVVQCAHLEKWSSSMGRMTSHILWKIKNHLTSASLPIFGFPSLGPTHLSIWRV
jgi:hypothetical protein